MGEEGGQRAAPQRRREEGRREGLCSKERRPLELSERTTHALHQFCGLSGIPHVMPRMRLTSIVGHSPDHPLPSEIARQCGRTAARDRLAEAPHSRSTRGSSLSRNSWHDGCVFSASMHAGSGSGLADTESVKVAKRRKRRASVIITFPEQ